MKKTYFILVLLAFFLHAISYSQKIAIRNESECNKNYKSILNNLVGKCERLNKHDPHYKDTLLINYILNTKINTSTECEYISNRNELNAFNTVYSSNEKIELVDKFGGESVKVNISAKSVNLRFHKIEYDTFVFGNREALDTLKRIVSVDGFTDLFGLNINDSIVSIIDSFSISMNDGVILELPDSIRRRIFNPNLSFVNYSIRPIQAFFSSDKKYIFIYIFGKSETDPYLIKLIYDKTGLKKTISINSGEFKSYQCFCSQFIGF